MTRRVVVTGLGSLSPVGLDTPSTWRSLLAGTSGVGMIENFDPGEIPCRIAAEIRDFDPTQFMDRKLARRIDRFVQFAIVAANEAIADSGIEIAGSAAERVGVYVGSGIGGLHLLMDTDKLLRERGPRRVSPFFIPGMILNMASGQISIMHGAKGPNLSCSTACATGCHSIGESYRMIREGYADAMIAGGSEATIHPVTVAGFSAMKALSTRNDDPEKASRPFDKGRDGFVMGEGAGIVVIEERELARARGARIYAELVGYGMSADAFHVSSPAEDGGGAVRSMKMALDLAEVSPSSVDYINAHGTSTPMGDRIEMRAVQEVFGENAPGIAFASSKSMTGHLLGAAGGLESVITALAVHNGQVPPTINLEDPEDLYDLDFVPNRSRKMKIRHALNNSFGFGGTNASLLFAHHPNEDDASTENS